MITVTKKFEFEAAHKLPEYEGNCRHTHGHTFKLEVTVMADKERTVYPTMIIDFKDLKKIVEEKVLNFLDHKYLNDIPGLEVPTSETLVKWIADKLTPVLHITKIKLYETSNSFCTWEKE